MLRKNSVSISLDESCRLYWSRSDCVRSMLLLSGSFSRGNGKGGCVDTGPNQALERTGARRVFTFQMIKKVLTKATLAPGASRSACTR